MRQWLMVTLMASLFLQDASIHKNFYVLGGSVLVNILPVAILWFIFSCLEYMKLEAGKNHHV